MYAQSWEALPPERGPGRHSLGLLGYYWAVLLHPRLAAGWARAASIHEQTVVQENVINAAVASAAGLHTWLAPAVIAAKPASSCRRPTISATGVVLRAADTLMAPGHRIAAAEQT